MRIQIYEFSFAIIDNHKPIRDVDINGVKIRNVYRSIYIGVQICFIRLTLRIFFSHIYFSHGSIFANNFFVLPVCLLFVSK